MRCQLHHLFCFFIGVLIFTALQLVVREDIRSEDYIKTLFSSITVNTHNPLLPHPQGANLTCFNYHSLKLAFNRSSNHAYFSAAQNKVNRKIHLSKEEVEGVQKFVFFVGYPRSGHSIIASMMDAHPQMILAHEYNLFREWDKVLQKDYRREFLYNALYRNSVANALSGWRSNASTIKGYTLGLDYKWQGRFSKLKVIGDKSGAVTSQMFSKDAGRFLEMVDELKETVGVGVRVIHVVRNPYDMISTRLLYEDGNKKVKLPASERRKHCNYYGISYHLNRTFSLINAVQEMLNKTNLRKLELHLADLTQHPRATMISVCRFLGVPCPTDYLDACEKKVFNVLSKTRKLVQWPDDLVLEVYKRTRPYPFLWRYSFQGD